MKIMKIIKLPEKSSAFHLGKHNRMRYFEILFN